MPCTGQSKAALCLLSPEQRYVTLGFLGDICVSIVHTETPTVIRVISFRRATRNEEVILFESLQN